MLTGLSLLACCSVDLSETNGANLVSVVAKNSRQCVLSQSVLPERRSLSGLFCSAAFCKRFRKTVLSQRLSANSNWAEIN